jgi:hypothetical protein
MTETTDATAPRAGLAAVFLAARHDPSARLLNVDLLAALVAALLPWTTTGVAIAMMLWIVAVFFTFDGQTLLRSLSHPASPLPLAFFALEPGWKLGSAVTPGRGDQELYRSRPGICIVHVRTGAADAVPAPSEAPSQPRGVDRVIGRGPEHRQFAVQFAFVRFRGGMGVSAGRWNCRRHNARGRADRTPAEPRLSDG